MTSRISSRISDLERRFANMIRYGVISSLDEAGARVCVTFGKITTVPLRWATARAGPDTEWWAPEVGEKVMILSPAGDLEHALVLPAIFTEANVPAGTVKTQRITKYADGTTLTYDRAAHLWHLDVPSSGSEVKVTTAGKLTATAGGAINVTASGAISITGSSIALHGPVTADSTITASGDVKAGSISLESHKHSGVQTGSGITGVPQ